MSFRESIIENFDNQIEKFISLVSEKYELDIEELKSLWSSGNVKKTTQKIKIPVPEGKFEGEIKVKKDEMSLDALKKKAKELGIPGISKYKASNKNELIELIEKVESGEKIEEKKKEKKTTEKKPAEKKSKEDVLISKEELKEKIDQRRTTVEIAKNKFGNYEHSQSGIVLDRVSQEAIGKQSPDGKIIPLTHEDIEMCKVLNFKYKLPNNIVSNSSRTVTVKDDDDDDSDEISDYEDEEEEDY